MTENELFDPFEVPSFWRSDEEYIRCENTSWCIDLQICFQKCFPPDGILTTTNPVTWERPLPQNGRPLPPRLPDLTMPTYTTGIVCIECVSQEHIYYAVWKSSEHSFQRRYQSLAHVQNMYYNFNKVHLTTSIAPGHLHKLYKKARRRSWHTTKCNMLYHLKWNINAWDTATALQKQLSCRSGSRRPCHHVAPTNQTSFNSLSPSSESLAPSSDSFVNPTKTDMICCYLPCTVAILSSSWNV